MFCTKCGKELDSGAKFCTECGAPAGADARADASEQGASETNASIPLASTSAPVPASQHLSDAQSQQADSGSSGSKSGAIAIVAFVAVALLAALVTMAFCSNSAPQESGDSSRETSSQSASSVLAQSSAAAVMNGAASSAPSETVQSSAQSAEPAEPELSPEEAALKSLDGWWMGWIHDMGYQGSYGHIHDGVIDWYYRNLLNDAVEHTSTVTITSVERFDENGAAGWRFVPDTAPDGSFAYYLVDGDLDNLPIYKTAFGYGVVDTANDNTNAVERFGITRITDPAALDETGFHSAADLESAKALAAQRLGDAAAEPAAQEAPFNQEEAEAQAREAASAAGKQVFTGRVRVTTYADRAAERDPRLRDFQSNYDMLTIMEFDGLTPYTAVSGDGAMHGATVDLEGESFRLPNSFAAYDGQTITIAAFASDMKTFSDTTGVLMSASVNAAELIAPLTEADVRAREQAASPDSYVLADSSTRAYSRAELEALDNHTLFLARNEIYARHGRGFKNEELRSYFAGKAWYAETVSPDAFNDGMLSGTEKANADLMLEIERSRNSPYV